MSIQWSLFVPAVVLLAFPVDLLMSKRVELRSFDRFRTLDSNPRRRFWWWVPAMWIDPFRAFAGAYLLRRATGLLSLHWGHTPRQVFGLLLAILAVGIVCQLITRRDEDGVFLAPMSYVAGLVAALLPWPVALAGLVAATVGLFALRQFAAFFIFGALAIPLLGFPLGAELMWSLPAAGAFALPAVVALVCGRTFEWPTRRDSQTNAPFVPPR